MDYERSEKQPKNLGPAKDPYSSENEELEESSSHDTVNKKDTQKQALGIATLNEIVYSYGLKLKKPHPIINKFHQFEMNSAKCLDQVKELKIEDILELLLFFMDDKPPTVKEVLISVPENQILNVLAQLKSYDSPVHYYQSDSTYQRFQLMLKQYRHVNQMLNTVGVPFRNTVQKNFLQTFFYEMVGEGCIYNGGCMDQNIFVRRLDSGDSKMSSKNKSYIKYILEAVKVKPDLVIGVDYDYIPIPVQVCCSNLYVKEDKDMYRDTISFDTLGNKDEFVSPKEFVHNHPFLKCHEEGLSAFTTKVSAELLSQLLATSLKYIEAKMAKGGSPSIQKRSFIGLFAHQFDIYLIKLVGSEQDMLLHSMSSCEREVQNSHPLFLQYFALPIDLSTPTHAIALSYFLKYYRTCYNIG